MAQQLMRTSSVPTGILVYEVDHMTTIHFEGVF